MIGSEYLDTPKNWEGVFGYSEKLGACIWILWKIISIGSMLMLDLGRKIVLKFG